MQIFAHFFPFALYIKRLRGVGDLGEWEVRSWLGGGCQKQAWNMTTPGQPSKNNMAPWPESERSSLVRQPLPAFDSSTLFCYNFFRFVLLEPQPISKAVPYILLEVVFLLFLFFFLLNVKFLQTVLTVYRSANVISADVCCRCWK